MNKGIMVLSGKAQHPTAMEPEAQARDTVVFSAFSLANASGSARKTLGNYQFLQSRTMTFSISQFEELAPEQLHDYMEPLLALDQFNVTPDQFAHLFENLDRYDHYRLVYALHLCSRRDFGAMAAILPGMLGHDEGSVACAAVNILTDIPAELVTPDLLQSVRNAAVEARWKTLVSTLQRSMEEKLSTKR